MDCTFCGKKIPQGTGIIFARKTGQVQHFCTRKCEMNTNKLHRQPRETAWTAEYKKVKATRITAMKHAKEKKAN
ncbi:MAG: 50S ribosomal protein L24e [Candidatus Iainarchaeum archaeon]|uniref:50S ribosomal protein L24e n=1 Tax=Candidatus Iainarchaeum sp. TaxID=3101447 RepID=A0A7T9DK71_9ARCH|nr:MAG: 50S ribosomal protein L24e [Candidatus Diapherotrites archaeon]